jgi:hypothetical protein
VNRTVVRGVAAQTLISHRIAGAPQEQESCGQEPGVRAIVSLASAGHACDTARAASRVWSQISGCRLDRFRPVWTFPSLYHRKGTPQCRTGATAREFQWPEADW